MRSEVRRSLIGVGAAIVMATLWSAATSSVVGQTSTTFKRTADGQPDLNGFWQALNTANWDLEEHGAQPSPYPNLLGAYLAQPPGLSVVEGGTIPYKPAALAKRKLLLENRLKTVPLLDNNVDEDLADPEAKCFQGGVPRSTYMPYPLQVIQSKDMFVVGYQQGGQSARLIRVLDKNANMMKFRAERMLDMDTWMGQSVGHWEGDTFVVDVRWFFGTTWLDRAGNFYGKNAKVTERYTPTSPYHMTYEATIDDPENFTRPWKISMPLYKIMDPKAELLEFNCIPFAEPFIYGTLEKKEKK